ncbi:hypothetical protein LFML04_0030 [Leptospirillum ferriphilum ML-04]|uniref:Uncharacterized protein n=1 Tax=Leptospirillum ferriphilum (strain ML-04) TaxID=1048260 RepID=J9Z7B9_LEPFM|nr:hypothetical protein LFML04_0030 [Leptospirillum ferriphilum ML-04]
MENAGRESVLHRVVFVREHKGPVVLDSKKKDFEQTSGGISDGCAPSNLSRWMPNGSCRKNRDEVSDSEF